MRYENDVIKALKAENSKLKAEIEKIKLSYRRFDTSKDSRYPGQNQRNRYQQQERTCYNCNNSGYITRFFIIQQKVLGVRERNNYEFHKETYKSIQYVQNEPWKDELSRTSNNNHR